MTRSVSELPPDNYPELREFVAFARESIASTRLLVRKSRKLMTESWRLRQSYPY